MTSFIQISWNINTLVSSSFLFPPEVLLDQAFEKPGERAKTWAGTKKREGGDKKERNGEKRDDDRQTIVLKN